MALEHSYKEKGCGMSPTRERDVDESNTETGCGMSPTRRRDVGCDGMMSCLMGLRVLCADLCGLVRTCADLCGLVGYETGWACLDEVGSVKADDMHSDDFCRVLTENDLRNRAGLCGVVRDCVD